MPQFSVRGTLGPSVTWRDVPWRRPEVLETVLDDHVVLLRPAHPVPHVLNTSGGLVWQALDGRRDLRSIAEQLAVDVGLPATTIEPDVVAAATGLFHAGLVGTGPVVEAAPLGEEGPAPTPPPEQQPLGDDGRPSTRSIGPLAVAGTVVTVATDDREIGDALERVLAPLQGRPAADLTAVAVAVTARGEIDDTLVEITVDGRPTWGQPGRAGIGERVVSTLNELAASVGTGHVVLHAGAVERDGRVVVITGHSGRGKSTLTAALVQRGFRYLTDEAAAISVADLTVRSYSKPLSLDRSALELLGVSSQDHDPALGNLTPPEALGPSSPGGRLALVVVLAGDEATAVTLEGIEPASPVGTLVTLLQTGFPVSLSEPRALDTFATIVETVPVLEMHGPRLDEACERIERALAPSPGGQRG